jgi:hypothetical protein
MTKIDPQNDANTPLEELKPMDVEEVNEEGAQPDESWGQQGQGGDAETDAESTENTPDDGK